ncbi:MAG: M43 family zinc metalloprotease [Saprospiraceae bacterium]|nr:M43 family zinc metalloprotease [Saprospiraceae bacterium]
MMKVGTKTIFVLFAVLPCLVIAQSRCVSLQSSSAHELSLSRNLNNDSLLTIPIVFHNLFRLSDQRIGEEQTLAQLDILNADFQRSNKDTIKTPTAFLKVAANCKINFCLTNVDSEGKSFSGINFKQTQQAEIGLSDDYYRNNQGGQSPWDPTRYLNIWVCEITEGGSIAGFANSTSSTSQLNEGVVIDYRFFGIDGTAVPPFDGGRTLTHEIGHWLGLNHIWGDAVDCTADDGLEDTPVQLISYEGCPIFPQVSCGSEDMFMNFMDLTDDACMNLFTQDQKSMMRQTLMEKKPLLLEAKFCELSVGTFDFESTLKLDLFPNPARERIYWEDGHNFTSVEIINMRGQLMVSSSEQHFVEIGQLSSGLYFLIAFSTDGKRVGAFLKI